MSSTGVKKAKSFKEKFLGTSKSAEEAAAQMQAVEEVTKDLAPLQTETLPTSEESSTKPETGTSLRVENPNGFPPLYKNIAIPANPIPFPFMMYLSGSKKRVTEALERRHRELIESSEGAKGFGVCSGLLGIAGGMLDETELLPDQKAVMQLLFDGKKKVAVSLYLVTIQLPDKRTGISSLEELEVFESASVKL